MQYHVTAVTYNISDGSTEHHTHECEITEVVASFAPMPDIWHPIDQWWVRSGIQHRTPFMTGTVPE